MTQAQFMTACMNEGASQSWCHCAMNHVSQGATPYQAATLCNKGLPAMQPRGGSYVGNRIECMAMRHNPYVLSALQCY